MIASSIKRVMPGVVQGVVQVQAGGHCITVGVMGREVIDALLSCSTIAGLDSFWCVESFLSVHVNADR